MKKKIILVLVFIGLLIITGCGNKEETTDEKEFTINNLIFHLDKEQEFKKIKYSISKDFKEVVQKQYIQYNYYQEDSSNLLFYRVFYYENKDLSYAQKDLGLEEKITLSEGKTDNIEYQFYATPRDDGGTIHFYFISKDHNIYVINFVSKYNIKDFENKVLMSIHF